MLAAVKANVRTARAAESSLGEALTVALRGGAISGILVVALSLLGVYVLFLLFGGLDNPALAPFLIVGYGFGASFVALFAPAWRGNLYQGCRRRSRPRGQDRGRNSGR